MNAALGRDALLDAFDRIGRAAVRAGTKLQIAVYGGSALMLASNFRSATEDVDVSRLEHPLPDWLTGTVREIARENRWQEDWFNEGLGVDYADYLQNQGFGVPTVKVECEFLATNKFGDMLVLELAVKRIGNSAITFSIRGTTDGKERVRATITAVHAAINGLRPVRIPDGLRAAMAKFCERGVFHADGNDAKIKGQPQDYR